MQVRRKIVSNVGLNPRMRDVLLLLIVRIFSDFDAHLWTTERGLDTPGADLVTFTRDRRLNLKDLAGTSQALNR